MADKYLVTKSELTSLADSIREKTGEGSKLSFPDGMISAIEGITGGGAGETLLKPGEYEDYIKAEAFRVANAVNAVKKSDSIITLCMSDSHYHSAEHEYQNSRGSATATLKAIKALSYFLPIDFIAHLGDVGVEDESGTATLEQLKNTSDEVLEMLKESCGDSIPLFVAIGNHDANDDIADKTGLASYLYNNYTKLSASTNTTFATDTTGGGYCYRDIVDDNKKLRVFLLNTCESQITGDSLCCISPTQKDWVLSKIDELNAKSDADQWNFIILSHYPLDFSYTKTDLSNALYTYVTGNGGYYSFKNGRKAKFLCQFHGHIHNFLYDKLHYGNTVPPQLNGAGSEQYDVLRLATPSTELGRENAYYNKNLSSTDGTMWGIKFFEGNYNGPSTKPSTVHPVTGEPVTITKGSNEKCTSFVVNVITPSRKTIHSFCYGAGYDRELNYDFSKTQYSVSFNLENMVKPANATTVVLSGDTYTVTLDAEEGYKLSSAQVSVSMNGQPQTGVYDSATGTITIPSVTGPIVITGKAIDAAYFAVTYDTLSITSSNSSEEVDNNDNPTYYTVLTPNSGLLINPHLTKVTMGGKDITSTCVTELNNGYEVKVSPVTGPISITAKAYKSNLWQFATDLAGGTNIHNNGLGYTNEVRLSSMDGVVTTSSNTAYVTTGLIPYSIKSAVPQKNCVIEIKGATLDVLARECRLYLVTENGRMPNTGNCEGKGTRWDKVTVDSTIWEYCWRFIKEDHENKHYIITPRMNGNNGQWYGHQGSSYVVTHICLSLKGKGEDLTITIREPASNEI